MGNEFEARQIVELPFEGRNPVEILSLQPGVTYTGPRRELRSDNMFDTRCGSTTAAE